MNSFNLNRFKKSTGVREIRRPLFLAPMIDRYEFGIILVIDGSRLKFKSRMKNIKRMRISTSHLTNLSDDYEENPH